jgi:hypothetical protein
VSDVTDIDDLRRLDGTPFTPLTPRDLAVQEHDPVNKPAHYRSHPSGVECIEIAEHYGFNVGNAIKYLWRAGLKSDNPIEDLKKAAWYVNREIERLTKVAR